MLRKTAIFYSMKHPHSTVQCLGWLDGEILATQLPAATPEFFADMIGRRALGFFVTTEDGSSPDNRVISNRGGRPVLDYDLDRIKRAHDEHEACIHDFERGCCTRASPVPAVERGWRERRTPSAASSPAAIPPPASSIPTARCTA